MTVLNQKVVDESKNSSSLFDNTFNGAEELDMNMKQWRHIEGLT